MEGSIFGMLHKKFTPSNESFKINYAGYGDRSKGAKKGNIVMNLRPATRSVVREHELKDPNRNLRSKVQEVSNEHHEQLQLCTVCHGEIRWNYPASQTVADWKSKVKTFYSRHFILADFMDVSTEACNFPFCYACAKQLEKLMTVERECELMVSKFQHLKDVIASRCAETYLKRVESESLFSEKDLTKQLH